MFTRPDELTDELVASVVAEAWGVTDAVPEYLAVGFGSHHWKIRCADETWFLTVDDLEAKRHARHEPLARPRARLRAALRTAQRLRDNGLEFVVAPQTTATGEVLAPVPPRFEAALYAWAEGRSHSFGAYATAVDRLEVIELLSGLHGSDIGALPAEVATALAAVASCARGAGARLAGVSKPIAVLNTAPRCTECEIARPTRRPTVPARVGGWPSGTGSV